MIGVDVIDGNATAARRTPNIGNAGDCYITKKGADDTTEGSLFCNNIIFFWMEPAMVNGMWNLHKEPRETERVLGKERKKRKEREKRKRESIAGIDSLVLRRCLTPANLNYLVL
jgi:hypothetical protein